MKRVYF